MKQILKLFLILGTMGCASGQSQAKSDPIPPGSGLRFVPLEELRGIPLAELPYAGYELPTHLDLSAKMPPPGHQQQQNSCAAWVAAYAVKTYQEKVENRYELLAKGKPYWQRIFSPAFVYNQINQGRDGGATLVDALNLLRARGALPWADMPYLPDNITRLPSAAQLKKARTYRIAYWRQVNVADPLELKSHLQAGYPVMLGALIDKGFYQLKTSTPWKQFDGSPRRGHALVVVGFDDHKKAFKVMNSWGQNWGEKGFGWIDYRHFRKAAREAYVAKDAWNEPLSSLNEAVLRRKESPKKQDKVSGGAQSESTKGPKAPEPSLSVPASGRVEEREKKKDRPVLKPKAELSKDAESDRFGNIGDLKDKGSQMPVWQKYTVELVNKSLVISGVVDWEAAVHKPEIIVRFYAKGQRLTGEDPKYRLPNGQLAVPAKLKRISEHKYRWRAVLPVSEYAVLPQKSLVTFDTVLYTDKFSLAVSNKQRLK